MMIKYIMYILLYNVQDYILFIIMMLARLYMRTGILLTCGKDLHDCIICLRGEVWDRTTR
jgi:hypothetical protein